MGKRALLYYFGFLLFMLLFSFFSRWTREETKDDLPGKSGGSADVVLVKGLLKEDLSHREFDFAVVAEAVSGKKVIPAKGRESSARVLGAITTVMDELLGKMNSEESPLKGLRRINEGSRFFEDGLLEGLEKTEGITCGIPPTREGSAQRSGYPDLRITDELTGDVYYLDPKLMERGSAESSLRTFYFEPKDNTLKITEDATHLLLGIEHDGKDGEWGFLGYQVVDLSGLKVRLKVEFQASNRDLYREPSVLEKRKSAGKDGGG